MPTWNEQLDAIARLREERDRHDEALYDGQLQLRASRRRLEIARRQREETGRPPSDAPGELEPPAARRLEDSVAELTGRYERAKDTFRRTRDALHAAIDAVVPAHPRDVLANFQSDTPFLLLPLRIETRFMASGDGDELWVRVYPDDIAVHTHETVLTPAEVAAGEKYWTERWDASAADAEAANRKSWAYLVEKFGAQRAAWVARSTRPTNWEVQPRPASPVFPPHDVTKPSGWSRAPRSKVMPDRLVLLAYQGDEVVIEEHGALIPDELIVGPDPLEEDQSFETGPDGELVFGDEFAWASDFKRAITIGMGFKVSLTPQQAEAGFDRIVVLGVVVSRDAGSGRRALEALIDNHHYSPKGFALLRQGTPTNNTDEGAAGFSSSDPGHGTSYYTDAGPPLFTEQSDSDGRRLADALGIDYATLQHVNGADATDGREAVHMNTALYPATLGYYFDTLLAPVLTEERRDALREFFVEHVSGRGPLPAIRVGHQPYGILLTSDFARWQTTRLDDLPFVPGFSAGVHALLKTYHAVWTDLAAGAAHVGRRDGVDPSATLMEILGLQAGSVAFDQRVGYSTEYLKNLDAFQFGGRYFEDMRQNFTSKNALLAFMQAHGYDSRDEHGNLEVPQLLRLVFRHYHSRLDAANLIDSVPLSEKDGIRFYDEAARKNYLHWLADAQAIDVLEREDFGAGRPSPNQLLYLMLRRSLLLQLHAASVRWLFRRDVDLRPTLAAANVHNIRPEPTLTKWEAMRAPVSVAAPQHPFASRAVSDFLLTVGRDEEEAEFLARLRGSLKALADVPTARLERLFTEHLDVLTYRLDGWITGMFDARLRLVRGLGGRAAAQGRRQGIYLGAFGWVENLKRSVKHQVDAAGVPPALRPPHTQPVFEYPANGGFVHAPSLNHATAAAVLRSGYLSHASSGRPEAMAVNISSERVRRALFVLQGIRNGQTLEALLGYQFERGLHDRASVDAAQIRLNEYIYDFRTAFPIQQHYIRQQGASESVQAIPANNVVNGVKLAEAAGDPPYGATGSVASASAAERESIRREKDRLADTLDAVKDLLTSEAVYQLIMGNVDRAGAVATALKDSNVPPEIEVIDTPRGSRLSFTNRLTLHFPPLDPTVAASNPWSPIAMTPRAEMEPGMNHWLGAVLGDPTQLMMRVAHFDGDGNELGHDSLTVASLQLQPIDLVYVLGNELNTGRREEGGENRTSASELEARIAWVYRDLKNLDDTMPIRIQFLEPADERTLGRYLVLLRSLKGVITDSRPVHAGDFEPPSKKSSAAAGNPEGYDATDLPGRVQRARNACDTLRSSLDAVAIDAVVKDENGVDQHHLTLGAAFAALAAAKQTFADIAFTFSTPAATLLQNLLRGLSTLGVADAFPVVQTFVVVDAKARLLNQAMSAARRAAAVSGRAQSLITEALAEPTAAGQVRLYVAAGKAILGDVFTILPRFTYHNEPDIQLSHADRAQLLAHATGVVKMRYPAEEWLHNASHVRPRAARWNSILSLHESYDGTPLPLQPVQLPYRSQDSWLAVEFPANDPVDSARPFNIEHDTLSIVIHGDSAFTPGATRSGLLIDEWTETIPTNNEITGISFNFNQPNAMPPQALLVAVSPSAGGQWTWDDLVGTVNDTLQRAKLRAVEPRLLATVNRPEINVLLPALLAEFAQYDLNVALDFRLATRFVAESAPIMSIAKRPS